MKLYKSTKVIRNEFPLGEEGLGGLMEYLSKKYLIVFDTLRLFYYNYLI